MPEAVEMLSAPSTAMKLKWMFCPAKESLVTGSTITSVLPEVVSPMVTAGESSAKSINSRPFTGRLTIWRSVITLLTCVRVVSITSEETATSTLSATPPGVSVKSSSAACPTCRITFLVCLPNPVNSTTTAYSPAGSAGIAYSPLSELCTVRVKPVEALNIVTLALYTLPPEVSTILPDSVAVMAWLRAAGATQMSANKHTKEMATDTQNDWIRFFTLTPENGSCLKAETPMWLEYIRAKQSDARTLAGFHGHPQP